MLDASSVGEPLTEGRYVADIGDDSLHWRLEVSIASHWTTADVSSSGVELVGPGGSSPFLGFFVVRDVYADPCHPRLPDDADIRDPLTARRLKAEFRSMVGFDTRRAHQAMIGDLPATHFIISNNIDTEAEGCTNGALLPLFTTLSADVTGNDPGHDGSPATTGGTTQYVWVIDRESDALLVIGEVDDTHAEGELETLQEMLDSVSFG